MPFTDRVTGDAPQPGETPRNESEPWSYGDPNTAWWRVEQERNDAEALAAAAASRPRHSRRRPVNATPASEMVPPSEPAFAPEALDAHAAGAQDAADGLAGVKNAETVALPVVERDHDRTPKERYNPPKTTEGYAVSKADESPKKEFPELHEDVPDVMVLPEPAKDRITVPLADRGDRVPGQQVPRMSDHAERRLQSSTFWVDENRTPENGAPESWPLPEVRERIIDSTQGKRPAKKPPSPRRALPGMLGLVALALVAAFFSWVSAEPFWLAVGHGDKGVATVGQCSGSGVSQRCAGSFAAGDGGFVVQDVALLGVGPDARNAGAVAPARMVSASSTQAYVGDTGWLVHLRWVLGFVLVLMCGYGIAGLTGARQLETPQARRGAVLVSLAGPILLLAGFLAAAY